jgi:hypothetical protein
MTQMAADKKDFFLICGHLRHLRMISFACIAVALEKLDCFASLAMAWEGKR